MSLDKERKRLSSMKKKKITIGTRGSKLALWQANWVKEQISALYPDIDVLLKEIKTTGDKILDTALAKVGGKGLFVKEIEESLLRKESDIAVHSMKDVPVFLPKELTINVICKREDPTDAFVSRQEHIQTINALPKGANIGTSSLRRQCQLLNIRDDLNITLLRGNIDTRLRKLDERQYDAIIAASAGLKRIGLSHRITQTLPIEIMTPAVGQGAIGIECRIDDSTVKEIIAHLNDRETQICVEAERAYLKRLEGGCQVPIGAYAQINSGADLIEIIGIVGDINGKTIIKANITGPSNRATELGLELANEILSKGAKEILSEVYKQQ
ncbi:porphobilinogen deaminase [Candidatus Magnetoovum chiemensis]|nr:porphobilinogen deaminase [Candidatus Magnetoovum chiemensis]